MENQLKSWDEVLGMNGFVIMRLVADAFAAKEEILLQFNSYIHQTLHTPSFVHENEGFFRLSCNDDSCSSAGIVEFGRFLQSTGYTVTGINNKETPEFENNIEITFTKGESTAHVLLSTLNVY